MAHRSGAWAWDATTKRAYYNDLTDIDHLLAVTDTVKPSKGDEGPETWKPPYTGDWCRYATDWATIKTKWSLTVTQTEYDASPRCSSAADSPGPGVWWPGLSDRVGACSETPLDGLGHEQIAADSGAPRSVGCGSCHVRGTAAMARCGHLGVAVRLALLVCG